MAMQFAHQDNIGVGVAAPAAIPQAPTKRYLLGPVADFWCFGGSALVILPLLLLVPSAQYKLSVVAAAVFASHFINNPHFAHSYQIFYRGFAAKAFRGSLGPVMQARYLFAGVIAPAALAAFFAIAIAQGNLRLLALAGNAMGLFVGWHYVKQGYGLLMVDCALKRQFFGDREKRLLLLNSYAVWIASWMQLNLAMARTELWGIAYFSFAIPTWLLNAAVAVAATTTLATVAMVVARRRAKGALPTNGVIAYFVSLYPWLALILLNPLWIVVVPVLHSLQYLAVVWRFQYNYESAQLARAEYKDGSLARQIFGGRALGHLAVFSLTGGVLGFAGFWLLPMVLGITVPHDKALFGATVFLFVFWVFINVHHYFMDNVMWRRDNTDTKLYLFS